MKMKKIIAPTMAQAIEKVKQELGNDAVIFHTKKVTSGRFFNLFKKVNIEVLAASDPEPHSPINKSEQVAEKESKGFITNHGATVNEQGLPFRRSDHKVDRLFTAPGLIESLQDKLLDQGMRRDDTDPLMQLLIKKWYQSDEQMNRRELMELLKAQLVQKLDPRRFQIGGLSEHFIMLVGPTGVGKTTTMAKLASRAVLDEGKKIAFITADTYRIAAIDQLRMYADILGAPLEVAYTQQDFQRLIRQFSEYDHVFIDTAGRNFQNSSYISELRQYVGDGLSIGLYLVVSATTKVEDMNAVITQFQSMNVTNLILSKLDETTTLGSLVSVLLQQPKMNVAYITNGQDVPDDLHFPNVRELINLMLGD
ncbi:flagellar biosynthesis protein FlhF [Sporolactobacillus kofuensis]|uniref:Flagellar biosynthesis protein FlhF n=1 Tax=Sporolactobacillus kofuensis TaxID=269672 RepID=A0ABW1WD08_9BACL|nr:flagellar biosynthesis protein FlhF [Sporolactobacillus kofuensis]MCO7174708.1 flagellar biosynthesis protein FlhF [Sporolactobacillus kofuensis]